MASIQAHILDLVLRLQMKSKLKGNSTLERARAVLGGGRIPTPTDARFDTVTFGGIAAERVTVPGVAAAAPLLYLHGGGYFACSPKTHRQITAAYARHGFEVFVPDYRLAPEHPYPAAIDDAQAFWNGLVSSGHRPESLAVSGDSAGGGLSLALMLRLREAGARLPAAAVLFSPWTDLAGTGASVRSNARRDAMFWAPGLITGAGFYLGGTDPRTPLASPLYAELGGLPPLLIHVGDREILRDDSTRLAERARAAGTEVELKVWPVVPHVWQIAHYMLPEARQSMQMAAEFLKSHLGARATAPAVAAE